MVKLKICRGRKSQLVVLCEVAFIFYGFISLLIGRDTINIPEIFSGTGVHSYCMIAILKNGLQKKLVIISSTYFPW